MTKIDPEYISPAMTDDTELAAEASSRSSADTTLSNRIYGLVGRISRNIVTGTAPSNTTYTALGAKFAWINSRNSFYENGHMTVYVNNAGSTRFIEFRLVNTATSEVLAYKKILATDPSGFHTFSIAKPTSDCLLEFQGRKETSTGIGGTIDVAVVEFDTIYQE